MREIRSWRDGTRDIRDWIARHPPVRGPPGRLDRVFSVRTITLGYNAVYLVETERRRVLVDAGPDYEGAAQALARATEGATPEFVVVTHGHNDHAGLGNW